VVRHTHLQVLLLLLMLLVLLVLLVLHPDSIVRLCLSLLLCVESVRRRYVHRMRLCLRMRLRVVALHVHGIGDAPWRRGPRQRQVMHGHLWGLRQQRLLRDRGPQH
jgi:hypothetical protein